MSFIIDIVNEILEPRESVFVTDGDIQVYFYEAVINYLICFLSFIITSALSYSG